MPAQRGFVVWFTGLSGSGKTTIARLLATELRERALRVEALSGEEFRQNISLGLGFSHEDRVANIRRIGYVAKLLARNGVAVITTAVSPYRDGRDEVRRQIPDFCEVFVDCPLDICEQRDQKQLYTRARAGLIHNLSGVHEPFEPPLQPDVHCRTADEDPHTCVDRILQWLAARALAPRHSQRQEEALIKSTLRSVGYS